MVQAWTYRGRNVEEAIVDQYRFNPTGDACGGGLWGNPKFRRCEQCILDNNSEPPSMASGSLEGLKGTVSIE